MFFSCLQTISHQCCISIPPENVRKQRFPVIFRGHKYKILVWNFFTLTLNKFSTESNRLTLSWLRLLWSRNQSTDLLFRIWSTEYTSWKISQTLNEQNRKSHLFKKGLLGWFPEYLKEIHRRVIFQNKNYYMTVESSSWLCFFVFHFPIISEGQAFFCGLRHA